MRPCHDCGGLIREGRRCPGCQQAHDLAGGKLGPLAYNTSAWQRMSAEQLAREPNCRRCGRPGKIADHIIPRRQDGADDPSNLQTLCAACHQRKTNAERLS